MTLADVGPDAVAAVGVGQAAGVGSPNKYLDPRLGASVLAGDASGHRLLLRERLAREQERSGE
ncbi:MAG: hypothetical protein IPK85_04395 [Gemmatimonadetes bacterium]|nr:hypothetical protein [Gemmatimonadota bacterium]